MDHWGDPWADNANDKSPTKNAVTSPLPPSFTFAPVPLNGFVDDAGWGANDDDGFGDWATSDSANVASAGVGSLPAGNEARDEVPGSAGWHTVTHEGKGDDGEKWSEPASSSLQDFENVGSEPSDSATVSQPDEVVKADIVKEPTPRPQLDTAPSVRSSTSPSETSRNDLPVESPRTSIEDDRGTKKEDELQSPVSAVPEEPDNIPENVVTESQEGEGKKHSECSSPIENVEELGADIDDTVASSLRSSHELGEPDVGRHLDPASEDAAVASAVLSNVHSTTFVTDSTLLAQLFPVEQHSGKELDVHDDPIHTTSARKAWYRLTRKQTMREFNHGDNDDNYVRVTWTNSHVRAEVNKIVGRWAREDRISGTGPGARASFYWDSPAPIEPKAPFGHSRTQSSAPVAKVAVPTRQSLPPLATDKAAAFDWSSPASADPWKLEGPADRPTSIPLALKNPAVAKIKRQQGRAVSMDLTARKPEQITHKRTTTVSHTGSETKAAANFIPSPVPQPSTGVLDLQPNLNNFDSPSDSAAQVVDTSFDDDDWGEMVQTPTLPTPPQSDPFSQSSRISDTLPTPPLPKLSLPDNNSAQTGPVEPMFSSPIVRLQSTISPTSATFKANKFVPLHVEHGPIGPGILKPSNRVARSISENKVHIDVPASSSSGEVDVATIAMDNNEESGNDKLSAGTTSPPLSLPAESGQVAPVDPTAPTLTPSVQPAAPVQVSADSWADADFSFFESALPVAASQPAPQTQDPSDPFSFFNTPIPASTPPVSKPFSGSPPRQASPLPLQPLTNATSSVQRRKAEEDQMISEILSGLPNLSYMLR